MDALDDVAEMAAWLRRSVVFAHILQHFSLYVCMIHQEQ